MNLNHPAGKSKAKFFRRLGFNENNINRLKRVLLKLCRENEVDTTDKKMAEIVIKYTIVGDILTPSGRKVTIKTIWALEKGKRKPHLVTAIPYSDV